MVITGELPDFQFKNPAVKPIVREEVLSGKKVKVEEGVFWIQKQRQMHSMHYISPYQACYPAQLAAFFIDAYSKKGDVVLDPFAGRGTTVLEANWRDRVGIGVDVSPVSKQLTESKLEPVTYEAVDKRLNELAKMIDKPSKTFDKEYPAFRSIYNPKTFNQILNMRDTLTNSPEDKIIKSVILGRLHGHSPGFFSVWTFNVIAWSPERIKTMSAKYKSKPEYRDIIPRIRKKAKAVLEHPIKKQEGSRFVLSDTRKMKLPDNSVNLVVTSPPFLDVINYIDDNWLRFWFLGADLDKLRTELVQTKDLEEYKNFMTKSMKEMNRVLKKGSYAVIEVGDVSHKSKKLNLDEVIIELADRTGFKVEKLVVNHISSPKISKAFKPGNTDVGTKTNRCVVLKKI